MTVLVLGGDGQLGRALRPLLPDGVFVDRELDITDRAALAAHDWTGTTAIANAAAWTAVDAAEQPDNQLTAWDVNATAWRTSRGTPAGWTCRWCTSAPTTSCAATAKACCPSTRCPARTAGSWCRYGR